MDLQKRFYENCKLNKLRMSSTDYRVESFDDFHDENYNSMELIEQSIIKGVDINK